MNAQFNAAEYAINLVNVKANVHRVCLDLHHKKVYPLCHPSEKLGLPFYNLSATVATTGIYFL